MGRLGGHRHVKGGFMINKGWIFAIDNDDDNDENSNNINSNNGMLMV